MGTFSVWHILILLIIFPIFLLPIAKILRRAGWSGWLCLLWIVPFLNLVMLWVFAYSRWPNLPDQRV